jgi:hypothetical protein
VAVKAAHFARPPGLGLDGREHGDNIRVRRGSEYSIRTLQNADEKHGASTDFFNRCTWYLIPRCMEMIKALFDDPKYWRAHAAQIRAQAEQMGDPDAKRMMLEIAANYDALAKGAEQRNKQAQ